MVLFGNVLCVGVCVFDTLFMSSLWLAWGQITAIFKEQGLFVDYCDITVNSTENSSDAMDCYRRDILFSNVYTTSNICSAVSSLVFGILTDRFGIFTSRSLSGMIMISGLTLMIFVEQLEVLIWPAWICIAIGAISGHISNVKMTLATPTMKGTFMCLLAGVFGAGGAVGLIMKNIMDATGIGISQAFAYWLVVYIGTLAVKVIFWSPVHLPDEISDNNQYSLFRHSFLIQKCSRGPAEESSIAIKDTQEETKTQTGILYKSILFNPNYYMIALALSIYIVRRQTYIAWLGSGWPEWVAEEGDPDAYNQEINRFQSILSFPLIAANLLAGAWFDFCAKRWNARPGRFGEMVGLVSCQFGALTGMITSSILQAQQIESAGYAAVVMHNIGRTFGILWSPLYVYMFPARIYGIVYGSLELITQCAGLVNIPMLAYNAKNDDYALMNYVIAALLSLYLFLPFATYRHYRKNLRSSSLTEF